jgi:hypothetical protein
MQAVQKQTVYTRGHGAISKLAVTRDKQKEGCKKKDIDDTCLRGDEDSVITKREIMVF